jgi:hypothetical protein
MSAPHRWIDQNATGKVGPNSPGLSIEGLFSETHACVFVSTSAPHASRLTTPSGRSEGWATEISLSPQSASEAAVALLREAEALDHKAHTYGSDVAFLLSRSDAILLASAFVLYTKQDPNPIDLRIKDKLVAALTALTSQVPA